MKTHFLRAFPIVLVISLTFSILHASCPEQPAEASAPPYLGLIVSPVSRGQQIDNDLRSIDPGVQVIGVDHLSPAEQARLRKGDIILYADGKPVCSQGDLDAVLLRLGVSAQIKLTILHEGERREITLPVIPLPRGYLCFEVVPLCERDSIRATLPAELAALDSLPVVSWVMDNAGVFEGTPDIGSVITGVGTHKVRMFGIVSVISPVGMKKVRSISELSALSDSILIGNAVLLQFYSRGKFGAVRYKAQALPKPWSGLRLEEMSPALIEAESLSVSDGEGAGLFVRKVEPGSPGEQGGFKPRDLILGFDGDSLESIDQFEKHYSALHPDRNASLSIRHPDDQIDTLLLRRSAQLDYVHIKERVPGMLFWERLGVTSHVSFRYPFPFFYWNKVTGPVPFGEMGADYFRFISRRADIEWRCGYGVDNERWQHSVNLSLRKAWLPTIRYADWPTPFYREQLSNGGEAQVFSAFAGLDRLNYVWKTGWQCSWKLAPRRRPAHAVSMNFDFVRETALSTVSQPSWISGRQEFTPNPVDDIAQGRFHRATLTYQYSNARWRTWTRTLLDAEVRTAGGALGGDHEYVRWELNGARSQRIFRRIYIDSRLRAGLATGELPLQEEFYAGGPGTLPGYEDREFSGNRTLLLNVQLSFVPFRAPEKQMQCRLFSGINTGNAWRSDQHPDIPKLRSDVVVGIGLFWLDNDFLFPLGISLSCATPIDTPTGEWRALVSFLGAFNRVDSDE